MDAEKKTEFLRQWEKYFPGAELPITFFYADDPFDVEKAQPSAQHRCLICDLAQVRQGTPLCFDADGAVCGGAKRYLGFARELAPNFEYFLSCGIPGKLEGERYKKTPELVKALVAEMPQFEAPAKYIVFKRWDALTVDDEPEIIILGLD